MDYNQKTKQFFNQPCFAHDFPSFDLCLTGNGVAALLGLSPWESRKALVDRLINGRKEKKKLTWEMDRGMKWKPKVYDEVEVDSTAVAWRVNPFRNNSKFYICDQNDPLIGGVPDGFLINKKTLQVTAGLTTKTSGLSSAHFWKKHLAPGIAAQNLLYMGLCGGIRWVVSVMFFCTGDDGLESAPWEIRSYLMEYDDELYQDIHEEARRIREEETPQVQKRLEEIRARVETYANTKTRTVKLRVPTLE